MEVSGRREEDGDEHTTGILCDPCLGVNVEENAVFYCTVCNEFLCGTDAKKHRKAVISKSHKLLDENSMPKQKLRSYKDNLCPFHSGKILEHYCNSHNTSCCYVCTTKEHKQCKVEYIDDIAKGYEKSSEYKSLVKDMADLTRQLHSVKQQTADNKNYAQRFHSEIISEIRKFREEINSVLDLLENASLKEANRALQVDRDATESKTTHCDTLMAKLQKMASSIESLRKYKQERQLVMHSRNARAQVNDIEDKLSKLEDLHKGKDYKFIPDKTIPELLRSLNSLGRFEITEESTKPKENVQKARKGHHAEAMVPVVYQLVSSSNVREINIQQSKDDTSIFSITGGVLVDQTKLALTDYFNEAVKVVDVISNTVISCIKLPSPPLGITRVDQDQVAVSCQGGILAFLKVGKTLSIVKQLNVSVNLRGIAFTNNSLLAVFNCPNPCVKVMDLRGKTLKTFKTNAAGHNSFTDPKCFALSEDQNTVFLSDPGNGRVTSVCMDGTVQAVCTYSNLRHLRGLAVDRNDNVHVAGFGSYHIHKLSKDCKPIRILLDTTHEVKYPWMVTYCKTEHKLYIGYSSGTKKNYLSVFQLQ